MSTIFTKDFTQYTKKMLSKYGDHIITKMVICRTPIDSMISLLLSALSLGSFDRMKHEYGYEKFFHLYIIVHLKGTSTSLVIEKNSTITISINDGRENIPDNNKLEIFESELPPELTLRDLMDATQLEMGDSFFYYESIPNDGREFANNCQNFIGSMIQSIDLLNDERYAFIYQPIDKLAKELPGYFKKITKHITDLGGFFDHVHSSAKVILGYKKGGIVIAASSNQGVRF